MQPNGAAMRFVPGSGVILQSSVLPPTFARRARQCLPRAAPLGGASLYPHPFNSTLWFCAPYGSSRSWRRAHFPPQASNKKTPAEGSNRAAGCCEPEAEGGSPSTGPTGSMLSSKGMAVGTIRDSGTRKLSTAPCPPRCRTSDNLVVFIRCPFTPESGQIADISGGLLCAKTGHRPDYSITSSARVRNDSEMVNPIVAAVLRFTISSNLVGN
jgi:hypothetical protein